MGIAGSVGRRRGAVARTRAGGLRGIVAVLDVAVLDVAVLDQHRPIVPATLGGPTRERQRHGGLSLYAMHYLMTVPADYDTGYFRERVAANHHLLDEFPGLGLKAYLLRERGVDGSTVHQYGSFYLWHDVAGMNRFLWGGGGFGNITRHFGRPVVAHWTGVAFHPGPELGATPVIATKQVANLPADDAEPTAWVADAVARQAERAATPGLHSTALAIDPSRWEAVRFSLWTDTPPEDSGVRYQVLHTSTPAVASLTTGQHW
jgi:hypothetical protein